MPRRLLPLRAAILLLSSCEREQSQEQKAPPQTEERRPYDIRFRAEPRDGGASRYSADFIAAEQNKAVGTAALGMNKKDAQAALEELFTAGSLQGWTFSDIQSNYYKDSLASVRLIGQKHSLHDSFAAAINEAEVLLKSISTTYGKPLDSKPFPAADHDAAYALLHTWEAGHKNITIYLDREEESYWIVYEIEHAGMMLKILEDEDWEEKEAGFLKDSASR